MRETLLGIDVGTTYCKAVLLDAGGEVLARGRARTPWTRVPTGAEIDPDAAVAAVLTAAVQATAGALDGRVVGVGVAGMGETGVLLDARRRPVASAIAWHDARGVDEAAGLAATFGSEEFAGTTGVPASPLCSLSKLAWQRSALPAAREAAGWIGLPEWVALCLGASPVSELSLASRTGALELSRRAWWSPALEWLGVPGDFMAEPVMAGTPVGRVSDALPAARGAQITVAGHDHLAAMVGAGATAEGDVLHDSGTAEVFVRTIAAGLEPAEVAQTVAAGVTVGWHVMPERWALLGGNELSVALASVLSLLGIDGDPQRDALDAMAAGLPDDEPQPRLAGVAGGSELRLEGISSGMTPAHVWRAALAAAADVNAATLARIDAVAGAHRRIVATGGGVRGPAARAAKEQRMGPIEWSGVGEATARGAALSAGVAAELWPSVQDSPDPRGAARP